jgi:hypothetical protein
VAEGDGIGETDGDGLGSIVDVGATGVGFRVGVGLGFGVGARVGAGTGASPGFVVVAPDTLPPGFGEVLVLMRDGMEAPAFPPASIVPSEFFSLFVPGELPAPAFSSALFFSALFCVTGPRPTSGFGPQPSKTRTTAAIGRISSRNHSPDNIRIYI